MTYKQVSIAGAVLFLGLALGLVFMPAALFDGWNVSKTPETLFLARRLAAGFFGFATIFWLGRNAAPSEARLAISYGLSVAMLFVAGFGVFEMARGFVGVSILTSVLVELALAACLVLTARKA